MHSLHVLLVAGAVASAGHVAVPVTRQQYKLNVPISIGTSFRRQNSNESDDGLVLQAVNNMTGGGYYSEFDVGSPPQTISFLLDTGSSDTWVNSVKSNLCTNKFLQSRYGFCMQPFDPEASDTFEEVSRDGFNITYLDGRNIRGDYFNDTLTIGGETIESQQLGLALDTVRPAGIMGLGFGANVAARRRYPTVVENMVKQGLIETASYSLYLNSIDADSGNILFGAIDQQKFVGKLSTMDLHGDDLSGSNDIAHFNVKLNGFGANVPDGEDAMKLGSLESEAILDSGSTICLLPASKVQRIHERFGVVSIEGVLAPFADCAWRGDKGKGYSFDFKFEGKTIRVPLREMVVNAFDELQDQLMSDPLARRYFGDWDSICIFGIGSTGDFGFEGNDFTLLGDTFLRSAYVVYDLANEQLGLAQANLRSDKSNIVEITSGAKLPDVEGVKGQSYEFEDAATLLSNPFRSGRPAVAAFMALMAAAMLIL